jgi:hypothetical protein
MQAEILRLESVVKHGVGGAKTSAINLIYSLLLKKHKINFYSYIFINQVGEDLNEFVMTEEKNVYINIRYPTYEDYELKTVAERDIIRLEVIHNALLRLAEADKRIEETTLNEIKKEIIDKSFCFELEYKNWPNKKYEGLNARVIIEPKEDWFDFYLLIERNGTKICKVHIYRGRPSLHYAESFFFYGTWKISNEFVIEGKIKEVEIHIIVDKCSVSYINLTAYEKAPHFERMKVLN